MTAEVFASCVGEIRAGRLPMSTVSVWLFGIGRHKLIDALRIHRMTSPPSTNWHVPVTNDDHGLAK